MLGCCKPTNIRNRRPLSSPQRCLFNRQLALFAPLAWTAKPLPVHTLRLHELNHLDPACATLLAVSTQHADGGVTSVGRGTRVAGNTTAIEPSADSRLVRSAPALTRPAPLAWDARRPPLLSMSSSLVALPIWAILNKGVDASQANKVKICSLPPSKPGTWPSVTTSRP
jgi:hypothetical protein